MMSDTSTGFERRMPEQITALCCYFQAAQREPKHGRTIARLLRGLKHGTTIFTRCVEGR